MGIMGKLREWGLIGSRNVYGDAVSLWSASHEDATVRDQSHWLGEGRWSDEEAWRAIGRHHWKHFERIRRLADAEGPFTRMVEWGPGGGANLIQFMTEFPSAYGVDISGENLRECGTRLSAFPGFQPVEIPVERPEAALEHLAEPVDFFLCTAVYQHFPSKDLGERVTKVAHEMLRDGGLALIQIRYDVGTGRYRPKSRDYKRNFVTFTSYPVDEFWNLCDGIGLKPLSVTLSPANQYAYYYLQNARPS